MLLLVSGLIIANRALSYLWQKSPSVGHQFLVVEPSLYNINDVERGTRVTKTFSVRNNNPNEAIAILDIKKSCGCTYAELTSSKISPMGETKLLVTIDTSGKIGPNYLEVTLNYKDSSNNSISIPAGVSMNVVSALQIYPEFIDFGEVNIDSSDVNRHVQIEKGKMKLQWDSIQATSDNLTATVRTLSSDKMDLDVELFPLNYPVGILKDTIRISLYNKGVQVKSPFLLPVRAEITSNDLAIEPKSIFLGTVSSGSKITGMLHLREIGTKTLKILSIKSSSGAILDAKITNYVNRQHDIQYMFNAGHNHGNMSGKLMFTVMTDRQIQISVPWIVYIK